MVPASPCDVTNPILAHISWTEIINGNVTTEVHKVANPKDAPA
jgi:hypothetical protein